MFEFMDSHTDEAVIKVIGVGGGGGNAVEHMVRQNIEGVEFITVNTDAQALRNSSANTTLQIGGGITKGLGAGANPEVGRDAAMEDREALRELLQTWCSSPPAWVVVQVRAPHLSWPKWPARWVS